MTPVPTADEEELRRLDEEFARNHPAPGPYAENPDAEPVAVIRLPAAVKEPRWPAPVPVSQLPDHGPVADWILHGMIARGHLSLIASHPKAGKTTWVSHFLKCLQAGVPFVGRATRECRTLYVSEESQSIWRGRRDALDLDDHLHLLCRPMYAKPTPAEWCGFLDHIHGLAVGGFDHVVIDTISTFAPWRSENDNAEITAAFNPLNRLTEAGIALTIFHHLAKGEGSEGRAFRGGSALAGSVDIMIELRRYKPDDADDRRRVLAGLGRFDEIPTEMVVTLEPDGSGYTATGDRKAEAARELHTLILDTLPTVPPGATAGEVHEAMPPTGRPQRSVVMKALQDGAAAGQWDRTGGGKPPKNPWRFWRG